MNLKQQIESLLFIAGKPLTIEKIAELTAQPKETVTAAIDELDAEYESGTRGLQLMRQGKKVQLSTHPEAASLIEHYIKSEQFGELTKPSLETLTIIAYRGPVSKAELEMIRGVNCSLILRNLLIKGLIEEVDGADRLTMAYSVTLDFLRYLGLKQVDQLPDYERLRHDEFLEKLMTINQPAASAEAPAAAPVGTPE